jgi:hypothetical protein
VERRGRQFIEQEETEVTVEVIPDALVYFLGMAIDLCLRIRFDPASLSTLRLDADGAEVCAVNWTAH